MTDEVASRHDVRVGENEYENRFNNLDLKFAEGSPTQVPEITPDFLNDFYMDIIAILILLTLLILVVCMIRELSSRRREYLRQRQQLQQGVELQPLRPAADGTKLQQLEELPEEEFDKRNRRMIASDLDERFNFRCDPNDSVARKTVSDVNNRSEALGLRLRDMNESSFPIVSQPEYPAKKTHSLPETVSQKPPLYRHISVKND